MGWTIHSTVPFPMLEHGETVLQLSRYGVGPEIYFSGSTLDRLTPEAAGAVAESLRSAGLATPATASAVANTSSELTG